MIPIILAAVIAQASQRVVVGTDIPDTSAICALAEAYLASKGTLFGPSGVRLTINKGAAVYGEGYLSVDIDCDKSPKAGDK